MSKWSERYESGPLKGAPDVAPFQANVVVVGGGSRYATSRHRSTSHQVYRYCPKNVTTPYPPPRGKKCLGCDWMWRRTRPEGRGKWVRFHRKSRMESSLGNVPRRSLPREVRQDNTRQETRSGRAFGESRTPPPPTPPQKTMQESPPCTHMCEPMSVTLSRSLRTPDDGGENPHPGDGPSPTPRPTKQ